MTLVGSHYYIWWLIIKNFRIITLVGPAHLTGILWVKPVVHVYPALIADINNFQNKVVYNLTEMLVK